MSVGDGARRKKRKRQRSRAAAAALDGVAWHVRRRKEGAMTRHPHYIANHDYREIDIKQRHHIRHSSSLVVLCFERTAVSHACTSAHIAITSYQECQ